MKDMTEQEFLTFFRKYVKATGVRALARACEVAPSTVTRITQGKLPPTPRVLSAFDMERVIVYRKVGKETKKNRALTNRNG